MQFSSEKLLSTNEEPVPYFDTGGQDTDLAALGVDLVEHAKAVIRAQTQLPVRPEGNRPFQGLWFRVSPSGSWSSWPSISDWITG